jgi:hypothetical protein
MAASSRAGQLIDGGTGVGGASGVVSGTSGGVTGIGFPGSGNGGMAVGGGTGREAAWFVIS